MMIRITTVFVIFLILCNNIFASWDAVSGKNGMVSTADKHATEIGIQILQKGGNAVDAAIAVGFALAVTYPRAGNIGGGGFMLIRNTENNVFAIDYREKAPKSASKNMYLNENGDIIPNASLEGYLASGVPGTVHGLYQAFQKFGSLKWEELIKPAIELAEKGFVIDRYLATSLGYKYDTFLKFPSSAKIFTKDGQKYKEGDLLIQKDLAHTLSLISENGPEGFYSGENAVRIANEMNQNGGLITEEDLKAYKSVWRKPIVFDYRGYTIHSMSPPSSGGIIMAEILNTLENINLSDLGKRSSRLIHYWVEAEKQAYADRAEYLGDSDFINIPIQKLISKEYAKLMFENIDLEKAKPSSDIKIENKILKESLETTHFSIVDQWGNAVSNTYTLNGSYGSGVVIEGSGILMNNEMDDFSIKAGEPNLYGLVGSQANAIEPEKRMLSSMTPTIITKDDSLYMIVGTPGGSTIITTVAQVISNVIDHHLNIREAIEFPRFHHQWLPDEIKFEEIGFSHDVLENLKNKGHQLNPVERIGDVQAIIWNSDFQEWQGWSDPRGNGLTKGYVINE